MSSIGEACGRLDLMGGVADYCGSHVLEAGIRRLATCKCELLPGTSALLVESSSFGKYDADMSLLIAASGDAIAPVSLPEVRSKLQVGAPSWAFYVVGCVAAYLQHSPSGVGKLKGSGMKITVES